MKIKIFCLQCGKIFEDFEQRKRKYCSKKCWSVNCGFQKGDLNPSRKPERRKEISEMVKGHITSEKIKKKISKSMKKALQNPELREKWRQKNIGRKLSLETITKIVTTRRKNHPPSIKRLIQKLDIVFSCYKRLLNMNEQRLIKCFTCGQYFTYEEIDCGHFASRMNKNTRWLEENTEPQCRKCNRFLEGVKDVFALNLQKKYGINILQKINNKKNEYKKFTPEELETMIVDYSQQIREMRGNIASRYLSSQET